MSLALILGLAVPALAPLAVHAAPADEIKSGVTKAGGNEKKDNLADDIKNITNLLLFLIGVIAVIAIVISGLRFVTANGNADQVKSAREGIIYAVVGIVVALMAYAIVYFVVDSLG